MYLVQESLSKNRARVDDTHLGGIQEKARANTVWRINHTNLE